MDYYKLFGWMFFFQVFNMYGDLLGVSDMMPYHNEVVVRDYMSDFLCDYDRSYRAMAFCFDPVDSAVSLCGTMLYDCE